MPTHKTIFVDTEKPAKQSTCAQVDVIIPQQKELAGVEVCVICTQSRQKEPC